MLQDEKEVKSRCLRVAEYMIETGATVRQAAKKFGVSKSTVHKDMTERLAYIQPEMHRQVGMILARNKRERHLRGGEATRRKYCANKE